MTDQESTPVRRELTADDAVNKILNISDSDAVTEDKGVTKPVESPVTQAENALLGSHDLTTDETEEPEAETEETEAETPEETEEEADETEEEPEESESDETVAEESEEPEPEPDVSYTMADGTEVNLDELKKGYLRQDDYTRKTQDLAEQRKGIAQTQQQFGEAQNALAQNLTIAMDVISPQLSELHGTDWETLMRDDPYEFAQKQAEYTVAKDKYQRLMGQAQQLVGQQKAKTDQMRKSHLAEQAKALTMAIPDLADPKKGAALAAKLRGHAVTHFGVSEQQAASITDQVTVRLLHDSFQLHQLRNAGLSAADKKVSKAPKKVLKPGSPQSKADKATRNRKEKLARVRRTGSIDDAVAAIMG